MRLLQTTWPRAIGLLLFAGLFIAACLYHFREADGFAAMLPDFVPLRLQIVYATGILELILAILLLLPQTRRRAGIWTAIYLVLIFPANIYAAMYGIPAPGQDETSQSALWIRLLFQPLLVWWVLWASRPAPSVRR
ncbi:hypothetical protein PA598K_04213 [Paenibacillus sp. 598K]|uniref:DoxX family protein n=1 Tax=Paenibacillus sp. 598K TaxID=1117987 RepID=UPI000FF9B6BE|nr:hypothetical protein [Paenibacillus sp. 598K]GBF75781.1 hypothetical protein PA598K_04213 [Paenibacillus sp. 598K]